jgi:hypothetical protein
MASQVTWSAFAVASVSVARLVRRCQLLLRWTTVFSVILAGILMIFEMNTHGDLHLVEWPSFGFVRPLVMLVLQPLAGLCLYHPAFRWMVSVLYVWCSV